MRELFVSQIITFLIDTWKLIILKIENWKVAKRFGKCGKWSLAIKKKKLNFEIFTKFCKKFVGGDLKERLTGMIS